MLVVMRAGVIGILVWLSLAASASAQQLHYRHIWNCGVNLGWLMDANVLGMFPQEWGRYVAAIRQECSAGFGRPVAVQPPDVNGASNLFAALDRELLVRERAGDQTAYVGRRLLPAGVNAGRGHIRAQWGGRPPRIYQAADAIKVSAGNLHNELTQAARVTGNHRWTQISQNAVNRLNQLRRDTNVTTAEIQPYAGVFADVINQMALTW